MKARVVLVLAVVMGGLLLSSMSGASESMPVTNPPPTLGNVGYGDHEQQVVDVWLPSKGDRIPSPVVVFLHGGGWTGGKKEDIRHVQKFLDAGIAVVSINYRFVRQAREAKVMPPVEWPMHDAKRAVQFVRSKAGEWNIDKDRLALAGSSAGACTSLWLAFHDDFSDPTSADPIARESTRVRCVAVVGAQTSLDPLQMKEWTPNIVYGGHAFGFNGGKEFAARQAAFAKWLEDRDRVLPWIEEYSPFCQASEGDPQVYLFYSNRPDLGVPQKDATHSANFGVKLKEKLDQLKIPNHLVYPGAPDVKYSSPEAFLIEALKEPERKRIIP